MKVKSRATKDIPVTSVSKSDPPECMSEQIPEGDGAFKQIVEASLNGIYQVDIAGRFVYLNDALAGLLGYKRKELLGKLYSILLSPQTLCRIEPLVAKV